MPRAHSLLAIVFFCAACSVQEPLANRCPHEINSEDIVPFEVILTTTNTRIRHDLSLLEIGRFKDIDSLGPGGKIQGLTSTDYKYAYKTGIAVSARLFRAPTCAWIDHLSIDLTPNPIEIMVPKDYDQNSCEYEQILAHERQHEDTHWDVLTLAADDLRRTISRADWLPTRVRPLAVANRAEAEKRIEGMIDRIVEPFYAKLKAEAKERQKIIDLSENYRWVTRRCSHWK
jgi:hypothetical protein